MIEIIIDPVPKPRMVRSDKWRKRPIVESYWAFKHLLTLNANKVGLKLGDEVDVIFIIPMPISWSQRQRERMNGKPHQQRPDVDNLTKGIFDCLLKEDSTIYKINAAKYWGTIGKIIFK